MKQPHFAISTDGHRYTMALPAWETDYIQRRLADQSTPYELAMLQAMASMLDEHDLVLDVGANIGNHTLYLAVVVGCRVVAFEPNPELCVPLRESISLNGLNERVTVIPKGVGEKVAKGVFAEHIPSNLGGQSLSIVGEGDAEDAHAMEVVPLDSIIFDQSVKAIKIDVEGMELDVLAGAQALIERDKPALFVEAQTEEQFDQLYGLLNGWGYIYWDTFNATPTHWFLSQPAVNRSDLQAHSFEQGKAMYSQVRELKALKQELREVRQKYRSANERINTLKAKLEEANTKYRQVNRQYDEITRQLGQKNQSVDHPPKLSEGKNVSKEQTQRTGVTSVSDEKFFELLKRQVEKHATDMVLQFGISATTLPLASAIKTVGEGCLVCVAEASGELDAFKESAVEKHLNTFLSLVVAPVEEWKYRYPLQPERSLKRWFSESMLASLPVLDWVVVDGPDWQGDPYTRYPALPSIIARLAPGAEVWMLGADDSRVRGVVDQWCADYSVSAESSIDGQVLKIKF